MIIEITDEWVEEKFREELERAAEEKIKKVVANYIGNYQFTEQLTAALRKTDFTDEVVKAFRESVDFRAKVEDAVSKSVTRRIKKMIDEEDK